MLPRKHIPQRRVREHAGHPSLELEYVGDHDLKWGVLLSRSHT
jgi:hypothetical protein